MCVPLSKPFERDNIDRLIAYAPGEQPQPGPGRRLVKLNTNENPFPPAPEVLKAIAQTEPDAIRRYPPPAADRCRQTAARLHRLSSDQVIFTNGGDELLRLAVTVYCQPSTAHGQGGGLGMVTPSYSLYPVLGAIHDTPMTQIPLADNFALPDDLADHLNHAGCRLALVVNPHAPSGRLEPVDRLERLARRFCGVLLVDEAYVDFAAHDCRSLVDTDQGLDNVLLLRTLSKGYSLAGLRCGYGLGHPHLIAALDKARDSYNMDILCQAAAVAALEHRDQAQLTWRAVIQERGRLGQELAIRRYHVYPSQTNFLLVVPPPDQDARSIYHSLKARGILVRYFDQHGLRDKLRVTIGKSEENDALLAALDQLSGP